MPEGPKRELRQRRWERPDGTLIRATVYEPLAASPPELSGVIVGEYRIVDEAVPDPPPVTCARCGDTPPNHWTEAPVYDFGEIKLGAASQMRQRLLQSLPDRTAEQIRTRSRYQSLPADHPIVADMSEQHLVLRWGSEPDRTGLGFKRGNDRVRLCYACQNELIGVIGKFFGFVYPTPNL